MALPIALQSLISSSLSLVDNIMVGRLGETELAAVGVGVQPFFIFWMVVFGFSSGSATFMSQFWGTHDTSNIKKTLGFAMCVNMCAGIVFFICASSFPEYIVNFFTNIDEIKPLATVYIKTGAPCFLMMPITVSFTFCLRSTQQTKIPLYTSTFAFCLNTFLNYVLIYGNFGAPELGVKGAALATVIARSVEMILVISVVFLGKNIIAGKFKGYFGWTKEFSVRILKNAIPVSLNESFWGLGYAMYTVAYARVGATEYAAVRTGDVIWNIFILASFSIGDAALILVGQRLGAGEIKYGCELAAKLLKIGVVIGVAGGLMMMACAKPIINFYNFTPEGEKYAFYVIIVYGATTVLTVFNCICVVGILRAGGDTRFAMVVDCGGIWCIGVPIAFISTQLLHLPIYLVVLLVTTEEAVKFFVFFRRFTSNKWANNVIGGL